MLGDTGAAASADLMDADPAEPTAGSEQGSEQGTPLDHFFKSPAPIRRIDWNHLEDMALLKHGSGSTLFTATFAGSPVVVKAPKHGLSHAEITEVTAELQHEAQVLTALHHPRIIRLFGAGTVELGDNLIVFFIVVEKLEGGTLHDRLANMSIHRMNYLEVLQCASALAEALHYLHHIADPLNMTIHRDIKPDNIGFDAYGSLRLFDFGLSTKIPRPHPGTPIVPTYKMTGQTGSVRYMAPEVALDKPYNHKVDIYSFSMVCWEMMHRVKPFMGFCVQTHMQAVCLEGVRPPLDRAHPPALNRLLAAAWQQDHNLRPSSGEVLSQLHQMIQTAEESAAESQGHRPVFRLRDRLLGARSTSARKDGPQAPSGPAWFRQPKEKSSSVWF